MKQGYLVLNEKQFLKIQVNRIVTYNIHITYNIYHQRIQIQQRIKNIDDKSNDWKMNKTLLKLCLRIKKMLVNS